MLNLFFLKKILFVLLLVNIILISIISYILYFYIPSDLNSIKFYLNSKELDTKLIIKPKEFRNFIQKYRIDKEGLLNPQSKLQTSLKKIKISAININITTNKKLPKNKLYYKNSLIFSSNAYIRNKMFYLDIFVDKDFYESLEDQEKEIFISQRIVSELFLASNINYYFNQEEIISTLEKEIENIMINKTTIVKVVQKN